MRNPNDKDQIYHNGAWVSIKGLKLGEDGRPQLPLYTKVTPSDGKFTNQFINDMLTTSGEITNEQNKQKRGSFDAQIKRIYGDSPRSSRQSKVPDGTQFSGFRIQLSKDGKFTDEVLNVDLSKAEYTELAKTYPRNKFDYATNTDKNMIIVVDRKTRQTQVQVQAQGGVGSKGERLNGGMVVTHFVDGKEARINIIDASGKSVADGISVADQAGANSWAFYGPDPENPTQKKLYVQERDASGNLKEATGTEVEQYKKNVGTRTTVNEWYTAAAKAQGWSQLSSLFCSGSCIEGWALEVDKIFHNAFLGGSEYWTEAICKQTSDIEEAQESAIFSLNQDGYLYPSASITATKQSVETPEGTEYLYHVSYLLKNPKAQVTKGFSSSSSSSSSRSSSGVSSRGSSSDQRRLDTQERAVWNEIKVIGREVSSQQARYSRTSAGNDYEYNIVFTGERTVELLPEPALLDNGKEIVNTRDDAFATYSEFNYNKVCIVFTGDKPQDAFYQEVNEICADIADISRSNPTILPQVNERARNSRDSGEFNRI